MSQIESAIKQCQWFEGAPISVFQTLFKAARVKHFENKTFLYRLGEEGEFVYCVLQGFVRIKITSVQGQEFAITEFSNNAWLGEFALADEPARMFEAQALEDSIIIEIPKRLVKQLAEEHKIIYQNLFLAQTKRTLQMCELLSGMLFYPLSSRVAGRLLWFAQHCGQQTDNGILIKKKMSQQELADLTLGSRQRVNKILKKFEQEQILTLASQTFLVRNIDALKAKTLLRE
ncbi:MAG: CRP/FNR family cyclic AMP-dependent transcriptional regulator [Paraglaciecola sp.]|jgi:CRP/FNR family cyclic AMP-dependent transcriptional regulator